jgi:hypothetical protein
MLNDACVIKDVRFIGFTGWTDWPASLAPPGWTRRDLFSQSSKGWIDDGPRDRNYHNDYREPKVGGPGSRNRLRPSQTLAWYRESMAFLRETLSTSFAEGTDNVILTRMGPASSVADPGAMHHGSTAART